MAGDFAVELDGEELVKQLDKVKTGQTRWFGFVKGSAPADAYLELSKTEGQITRSMMKAKKGRTTVVVTGEVTFVDGAFSFDTVGKSATESKAMRKQMKEGLSKHDALSKHKQRLKQATVDGEVVDDEPEDTESASGAEQEAPRTEERDEGWGRAADEAQELYTQVKAKLGQDDPGFAALKDLRSKALEEKRGGDIERGIQILAQLVVRAKKLLAETPKATSDDWKRLSSEAQAVYGAVRKAHGEGSAELERVDGLRDEAVAKKKRGDLEGATELLELLIQEGKAMAGSGPTADLRPRWEALQGQAQALYGEVQKKLGKDSSVFASLEELRVAAVGKKKAGDLAGAVELMARLVATGVDGLADGPPLDVKRAADVWQSAIDDVNIQLSGLAGSLRSSGNPALEKIADLGLNALVDGGGLKVPLMARIFEIRNSEGDAQAKSIQAALELSARFNALINTDKRYEAVDANPFGVKTTIRATMTGALQTLDRSLRAAL